MINFSVIVVLLAITISKKTDKTIVDFFINILGKIKVLKKPEEKKEHFHNYLKEFNMASKLLFKDKIKFLFLILCQFMSLICLYLIPLVLFLGIGVNNINAYESIIVMSYVMLIGSFVAFFTKFIKGSKLNAIMLVWRFITYYFGMILGAIVLNFKKEKKI